MNGEWLTITYRDFYDFPRAFVVEHHGEVFFFDCPFDEKLDDYPSEFRVYRLPSNVAKQLTETSWVGLADSGQFLGSVPVTRVQFDNSKRQSVNSTVISAFA
jgi:hypothetical protein